MQYGDELIDIFTNEMTDCDHREKHVYHSCHDSVHVTKK